MNRAPQTKNSSRNPPLGSLASKWGTWILIGILILAAVLRLYGLSRGDTLTDEALYAFRAIGPLDFDEAEAQTTPLEWQDPNVKWWTSISFHDHPPLVFWVQHVFIKTFGETNFAFRLPSVILGLLSIWLLYLIGKKLYSEEAGLFAALLLAITVNHVYISRAGLQEAYVIFFILIASYLFLRSLEQDKYLIWTGIALGLGFLAKYTVFMLVPLFLAYLAFAKRAYFLNKKLWVGALLSLIIFSPVMIYNIMLYRAVEHFDFQISYIVGQNPEVWKVAPGKEVGTLLDRIRNFLPSLLHSNSYIFLSLSALSFFAFLLCAIKSPREAIQKHALPLLTFFFLIALLLRIGPSYRFLSMLTPFLVLSIGVFLASFLQSPSLGDGQGSAPIRKSDFRMGSASFAYLFHKCRTLEVRHLGLGMMLALPMAFEIFYSVNSQIAYYPKGPKLWAYSELRYENANRGYNELAKFLKEELKGKMPAIAFESKYKFVERIQLKALKKAEAERYLPYPALIIYDRNVQTAAQLWVLDRLHIYHGWPVIATETYLQFLKEQGFDYFERSGFKVRYFIIPTDKVPKKAPPKLTALGAAFEKELIQNNMAPISIKNKRGEEAFRVYKF